MRPGSRAAHLHAQHGPPGHRCGHSPQDFKGNPLQQQPQPQNEAALCQGQAFLLLTMRTSIHSLTHSFIHSFTHSFIQTIAFTEPLWEPEQLMKPTRATFQVLTVQALEEAHASCQHPQLSALGPEAQPRLLLSAPGRQKNC